MTMTTPPDTPVPAEAETISIYQAIGGPRGHPPFPSAPPRPPEPRAAHARQALMVGSWYESNHRQGRSIGNTEAIAGPPRPGARRGRSDGRRGGLARGTFRG